MNAGYHLVAEKNRYRFTPPPNLNKLLADRGASVHTSRVDSTTRLSRAASGICPLLSGKKMRSTIPFPSASTFWISARERSSPEQAAADKATRSFVDGATKEHGSSARTFKSGLIWVAPEGPGSLRKDARKALAWEDIKDEELDLRLDDGQKRQLAESLKKAQRDIRETVLRTYKNILLLGKNGEWKTVDLGLVHSSAAPSIAKLIVERLGQAGDIEENGVSPNFLIRNWSPAFKEWSTKSVRDTFFASPQYPRLLKPNSIKDTIARGVENGMLGYVGRKADGSYSPFHWKCALTAQDVEISDDVYVIQREIAEAYKASQLNPRPAAFSEPKMTGILGGSEVSKGGDTGAQPTITPAGHGELKSTPKIARLVWSGDVPPQKWMNFYTKVLSKFATSEGLKLTLSIDVAPPDGISAQKVDETKVALRELGLKDMLDIS